MEALPIAACWKRLNVCECGRQHAVVGIEQHDAGACINGDEHDARQAAYDCKVDERNDTQESRSSLLNSDLNGNNDGIGDA